MQNVNRHTSGICRFARVVFDIAGWVPPVLFGCLDAVDFGVFGVVDLDFGSSFYCGCQLFGVD